MVDAIQAWLGSGEYAVVHNVSLRPVPLPNVSTLPLVEIGQQGSAYHLVDNRGAKWTLKKFISNAQPDNSYLQTIQSLVPRRSGFEAGFERQLVSGAELSQAPIQSVDLGSWLSGTVLMPHVDVRSWAGVIHLIRDGSRVLSRIERLMLARRLSEAAGWLESSSLAHRDLSSTNVLVDVVNVNIHFIDWDSLFHPTLNFQPNAVAGSHGYLAPFVKRNGVVDAATTWDSHADRFALAALIAELLTVNASSKQHHEGGLFDQEGIFSRSGANLYEMKTRIRQALPAAASLFDSALNASDFNQCPGPADWLAVINEALDQKTQTSWNEHKSFEQTPVAQQSQTDEPHFVEIDESVFVKIDPQIFVKTPKKGRTGS